MHEVKTTVASRYPKQAMWLRVMLLINLVLLVVGLIAPIITLKKFILIENTFSVFSGAVGLIKEGHIFLFILIAGFSIVLPLLKIGILNQLLILKEDKAVRLERYLHWMHLYGKWAMLDVFVVAVLIVAVKLGALVSVELHYGLYAFAAAVILTMYITARVVSLINSSAKDNDEGQET